MYSWSYVLLSHAAGLDVTEVPLRLVGGSNPNYGRLEVFYSGIWGTVCHKNWTKEDAAVACGQLGLGPPIHETTMEENIPAAIGPIMTRGFGCRGDETSLADCPSVNWGYTHCIHSDDVKLECSGIKVVVLYFHTYNVRLNNIQLVKP